MVPEDIARSLFENATLVQVSKELVEETAQAAVGYEIDSPTLAQMMARVELLWQAHDSAVAALVAMILKGEMPARGTHHERGAAWVDAVFGNLRLALIERDVMTTATCAAHDDAMQRYLSEYALSKGLKRLGRADWGQKAFHTGEAPAARMPLGMIARASRRRSP